MDQPRDASEETFLRYFSRDRHRIYRFIYSLAPNEADAEDIFQQASIALWKNFASFDQQREFYPWACGVGLNAVRNFRRAAKRHAHLLSDELIDLIACEQMRSSQRSRYRSEMLGECIGLMKPRDRELMRLIYGEELPAGSAAARLGRTVQTVYNRLNIIRKQLLECVNRKTANA